MSVFKRRRFPVEIMRMIRRGRCILKDPGAKGEVRFISKLLVIAA